MTDPPILAVRVSLRHPDGVVVERVRLCWRVQPSAADVLQEIAARLLSARRRGLELAVDDVPADLRVLLDLVGLGGRESQSADGSPNAANSDVSRK